LGKIADLEKDIKEHEKALKKLGSFPKDEALERVWKDRERVAEYIKEHEWIRDVLGENLQGTIDRARDKLKRAKEYMSKKRAHEAIEGRHLKAIKENQEELKLLRGIRPYVPHLEVEFTNVFPSPHSRQPSEGPFKRTLYTKDDEPCWDHCEEGTFSVDVKPILERIKVMKKQARGGVKELDALKGNFEKTFTDPSFPARCGACGKEFLGQLRFKPEAFHEVFRLLLGEAK
jgi:hypothetical protein